MALWLLVDVLAGALTVFLAALACFIASPSADEKEGGGTEVNEPDSAENESGGSTEPNPSEDGMDSVEELPTEPNPSEDDMDSVEELPTEPNPSEDDMDSVEELPTEPNLSEDDMVSDEELPTEPNPPSEDHMVSVEELPLLCPARQRKALPHPVWVHPDPDRFEAVWHFWSAMDSGPMDPKKANGARPRRKNERPRMSLKPEPAQR